MNLWWDFRREIRRIKFWVEAVGIIVLIIYTIYNREAADAAKSAAETAAKQMELGERPWIGFGDITVGNCDPYFANEWGLNYDHGTPRLGLCITLKNYGRHPARVAVATKFGNISSDTDCDRAKKILNHNEVPNGTEGEPSYTVMPEVPWTYSSRASADGPLSNPVREQGIVGCIAYKYEGDGWRTHQTPFFVMVQRRDRKDITFNPRLGDVDAKSFQTNLPLIIGDAN